MKTLIKVASLCKQMNFNVAYLMSNRASCRYATKGSLNIIMSANSCHATYKIKMSQMCNSARPVVRSVAGVVLVVCPCL